MYDFHGQSFSPANRLSVTATEKNEHETEEFMKTTCFRSDPRPVGYFFILWRLWLVVVRIARLFNVVGSVRNDLMKTSPDGVFSVHE